MSLEQDSLFYKLFATSTDVISAIDTDYRFIAVNAAFQQDFQRLFGRSIQAGVTLMDALEGLPEQQEYAVSVWRRALEGSEFTLSCNFVNSDGRHFSYDCKYHPIFDGEGRITGAFHVARDVSDREALADAQAELRGRERQEHLSLIQAVANIGVWSWNSNTGEGFCSPEWYRLYGREPRTGLLNFQEWLTWLHPEDRIRVDQEARDANEDGGVYESEFRVLMPDGGIRWLAGQGRVLRDEHGEAIRIVGASQDITARKAAEQRLRNSEERYRRIIETAAEGMWVLDPQGKTLFANQRMAEMLGTSLEDLTTSHGSDYAFPEDADRLIHFFAALVPEQSRAVEFRLRRKDGKPLWVSVSRSPMDQDERFAGILGMFTDVSLRRRAEQALRRREAMFRQMADTMPQLVWTTRPNGYHDYYNKRWYEFTGATKEETKGEGWNDILHPEDRDRAWERWRHSLQTGDLYQIEYRFRRASDGQYRWFLARAEPIRDESGNLLRWFGTCTDIHDHKQIEQDLRHANSDLEQFAFAASHDLQESLRMITTYTQLLERRVKDKLEVETNSFLHTILDSTKRMELLLQDLLAYTHAAQASDESSSLVDLNHVLDKTLLTLSSAIAESGAVISSERLPVVRGEEVHFVQLFQNLISNSIKYRSEKSPEITIGVIREELRWKINVRDNGQGIDPQYQKQIFGVFKRLHGRAIPGTGIGLAICTKVVERYGGHLRVESSLGNGSTFSFTLPTSGDL